MASPLLERFYSDVKSLNLRFPVAEITKKTGYPKSNVSEYLSRKKIPSTRFMAKFYECYYPEYGITENMQLFEPEEEYLTKDKYIDSLKELIEAQKLTIKSLQARIADLELQKGNTGGRRHSA